MPEVETEASELSSVKRPADSSIRGGRHKGPGRPRPARAGPHETAVSGSAAQQKKKKEPPKKKKKRDCRKKLSGMLMCTSMFVR